jgi:transposase-like protein
MNTGRKLLMPNRVNDILSDEEIVRLVDNEGMSYKEIAEQIGFHHKTIYKHYRAGKKELEQQKEMEENIPNLEVPEGGINWQLKEQSREPQTWWEKFLDFFGLF